MPRFILSLKKPNLLLCQFICWNLIWQNTKMTAFESPMPSSSTLTTLRRLGQSIRPGSLGHLDTDLVQDRGQLCRNGSRGKSTDAVV